MDWHQWALLAGGVAMIVLAIVGWRRPLGRRARTMTQWEAFGGVAAGAITIVAGLADESGLLILALIALWAPMLTANARSTRHG